MSEQEAEANRKQGHWRGYVVRLRIASDRIAPHSGWQTCTLTSLGGSPARRFLRVADRSPTARRRQRATKGGERQRTAFSRASFRRIHRQMGRGSIDPALHKRARLSFAFVGLGHRAAARGRSLCTLHVSLTERSLSCLACSQMCCGRHAECDTASTRATRRALWKSPVDH